ncbi:hypothetical protein EBOKLHFM_00015 [Klebsiella phage KP13-26]|nr:hypothetical protein EBOKLHFM_00015 [Klebsiella phage KP13-26]
MTNKDKATIRAHYPHLTLRFKADGSVMASSGRGYAYGLLYTAEQAQAHLNSVK